MKISNWVKIGGFQKFTLIDFPERLAAIVFTSGCSFRCPFCYNPELVLPEKIKNQPIVSEKDIFVFLKERQGLIEGVVLTGGEPTLYKELPALIKKIKKLGYSVKLDTNGSNPKMLEELIDKKLIDYVAMDIKAPLGVKAQSSKFKVQNYETATGVKGFLEKVKKSVKIIKDSGIDYEFRTTVVPTLHTAEDILEIARHISGARKYCLQNFSNKEAMEPGFRKITPYTREQLEGMRESVLGFVGACAVR